MMLVGLSSFKPTSNYNGWTKSELYKLNTARNAKITSEEKEVILLCNMARTNPKKFNTTVVTKYLGKKKLNSYEKSLIKSLKKQKSAPLLYYNTSLQQMANNHAEKMGKSGKVGHNKFNQRAKKYCKGMSAIAENCDYGNKTPIDIVMCLLIDNNVKNLGHRKNILNKNYNKIGVAIRKHKTYGVNCVMDFAN